jgi:hypothetical protein
MANLNIMELSDLKQTIGQGRTGAVVSTAPLADLDSVTTPPQILAIGAGNVQSAALHGQTEIVRLDAEDDCWIAYGEDPDATTDPLLRLAAGQVEYLGVSGGNKLAVTS